MEKKEKNFLHNGPFLGCDSEVELFDKLFEKSIFAFPDSEINERWCAAGRMAHLICLYVNNKESCEMINLNCKEDTNMIQYLSLFEKRCFVSYKDNDGIILIKINRRMIRKLWLNADHQITEREFRIQFVNTITGSIKEIVNKLNCSPEEVISVCNTYESLNCTALILSFLAGALNYEYKNTVRIIEDLVRNYKPDKKEGDQHEKKET